MVYQNPDILPISNPPTAHDRVPAGESWRSRRRFATDGLAGLSAFLTADNASGSPISAARRATPNLAASAAAPTASELIIDVRIFGARGDGITNDAPAINAAFREAKNRRTMAAGLGVGCRIVFPTAVYLVQSSINLTGVQDVNTIIEGQGSAIIGRCAGEPVLDALGSRWLTIRDLTILGDRDSPPSVGLQIGRSGMGVADDHLFVDLRILGHFGLACLYNRAAETSEFDHLLLWNDHSGGFCLIQDGLNRFGVSSSFIRVDVPLQAGLSFNENLFINCDFRHGSSGTPVWLGDTTRHAFVRCYSATSGQQSFIICCGPNSHRMLDVDCHCEAIGLHDVFLISSDSVEVHIHGLAYTDHATFASRAVLASEPHIKLICLEQARLHISDYWFPSCRVFAEPALWEVTGDYASSKKGAWNGNSQFIGSVSEGRLIEQFGQLGMKSDSGNSATRLSVTKQKPLGYLYFDTTIRKLLVWSGNGWIDTAGTDIDLPSTP